MPQIGMRDVDAVQFLDLLQQSIILQSSLEGREKGEGGRCAEFGGRQIMGWRGEYLESKLECLFCLHWSLGLWTHTHNTSNMLD